MSVGMGRPPTNARQAGTKFLWIGIWLAFMSAPVKDLVDGDHTSWATGLGTLGLVVFVGAYLVLVFRHTSKALDPFRVRAALAFLGALAVLLSLTLGTPWLVLFVYVSVSVGATLPLRAARWLIPAVTAVLVAIGATQENSREIITALAFPSLLGGFAMSGIRQMIRTTIQLREARATVAQLAANEERLRLARDLHDLLGHSLSLITLKSELAGRMLPPTRSRRPLRSRTSNRSAGRPWWTCAARSPATAARPSPVNWPVPGPRSPPPGSPPPFRPSRPRTSPGNRRRCSPGPCGKPSPTSYATAVPAAVR